MAGLKSLIKKEMDGKLAPMHEGWTGYFACFGGLSLTFFALQALSGVVLLAYYSKGGASAGPDVMSANLQPLWLLRRMHLAGAHFMIAIVLIHFLKVFISGAYRSPRELNWISGVALLILTLLMAVSGFQMPWAESSWWTSSAIGAPWSAVADIMKYSGKGAFIKQVAAHCVALPLFIIAFMAGHFIMIRRHGIAEPL